MLRGPAVAQIVGARDALTARLIEEAQFEGIWASGLEICAAHGLPDAGLLTMSEFLEAAYVMHVATQIPIIADCDTGFGSIRNTVRLVEEYERHGITAVCIEDKVFPKVNSYIGSDHLLESCEAFSERIAAAAAAREDPSFSIIARVEALIAGRSIDEALDRAVEYEKAGADSIIIHSRITTAHEIAEFMERWTGTIPIGVIPTMYPQIRISDLASLGVRFVIYANPCVRSIVKTLRRVLNDLRMSESLLSIDSDLASMQEILDLQSSIQAVKEADWIVYSQ
jgi:phosphoenolpyruvate phosphomutase